MTLTDRESQHARLIIEGLSDHEIARVTCRTADCVRQINHRLYRKLSIGSRLELFALIRQQEDSCSILC